MHDLFYGVQLVASPEHAQLAHVTDLSAIRPYVKTIVMKPTKYSWTMTEHIFGDIVLIAPLLEFCDEENRKIRARRDAGEDVRGAIYLGRDQFAKLGMKGFVHEYMNGKMPFLEQEIEVGFERYMRQAQRTLDAFKTKEIECAWTKALMQLPDVHTCKIGKWDYNYATKKPWKDIGCNINGHQHNYGIHEEAVCRQLQEPIGEALCSAAIASLIAAQSEISDLTVDCVVDGSFAWADNGELDDLDLSRLQALSFQPCGAEDYTTDLEASVSARYSLATTALLRKCSGSLQNLDFCSFTSSCPMSWPPSSSPDSPSLLLLPRLTRFRTSLTLRLSAFAQFLHRAPALTHLHLESCYGEDGQWRDIWDAIRTHPSRMMLDLEQLPCFDWGELGVYHHTGEASKQQFAEDLYERLDCSLENYLSGKGHWDRSLRMWFDGDDEPSEDEDEDSSEDEDADENSGDGDDAGNVSEGTEDDGED